MSVKYHRRFSGCDIIVRQDKDVFQLCIQSRTNPLGFGNRLAEYATEERAVEAADHFCRLFNIVKEFGYHLDDKHFVKPDMPPIPLVEFLELQMTTDRVRAWLKREAAQHARIAEQA